MSRKIRSNDTVLFMVITSSEASEPKSDRQLLSLDICQFALRDAATKRSMSDINTLT